MIEIVFRNGDICYYNPDEYTEYKYDGRCFIVIRDEQWIGFYNLDCVKYIEVHPYVSLQRELRIGEYEVIKVPASEAEKYIKDGWVER